MKHTKLIAATALLAGLACAPVNNLVDNAVEQAGEAVLEQIETETGEELPDLEALQATGEAAVQTMEAEGVDMEQLPEGFADGASGAEGTPEIITETDIEYPPVDPSLYPPPAANPSGTPSDTPKIGDWRVANHIGTFDCPGLFSQQMDPLDKAGTLTDVVPGESWVGHGFGSFDENNEPLETTFNVIPGMPGHYVSAVSSAMPDQNVTVTIFYYNQIITDEYQIGYLILDFDIGGIPCHAERPYEVFYLGE